ncbi:DNA helicase IV [Antricoccus suffuscus]|uniref:DNA helicase IV n=1 Tax=Antricoccus suffuscus TaxID=1629062 RepID=A0A2T0ZB85_9ACTN|nr:DNA helicase IV [Antricoccus suffuscus]
MIRSDECLNQMRAVAEGVGDAGSDAWTSEVLGRYRAERLESLKRDRHVPPFFGRIDFDERADGPEETFHVGRRHIRDEQGDPIVIDWRAPMSEAFYQATSLEPRGVRRRRRFGFADGALTSYEDENLQDAVIDPLTSQILLSEIERPRVGPMRDIVATIQPDQDDIVRSALDVDICVQGAPGTGKTAVGLHRAAYLLYTYPDQLKQAKVLIVGPNTSFLSYIGAVLPALGEFDVDQSSVEQITDEVTIRGTDRPEAARVKGEARMAQVIANAVRRKITKPRESVQLTMSGRKYRVSEHHFVRYVDDIRRSDVSYLAGRERLSLALAEDVRRQKEAGGGSPTDAELRRTARSREAQAAVQAVWPLVTAPGLIFELLTNPDTLAGAAHGILDENEIELLLWDKTPASVKRARWSVADAVLVDEAAGLLNRVRSYGHVILDEAQDLSPMQCRCIARRCVNGSLTVLGDIAQGTTDWAATSWAQTLEHLGRPQAHVEPLTLGYRVPGEVIDFSNQLLPLIAPELPPASSVRPGHGSLRIEQAADIESRLAELVIESAGKEGTTAVICADASVTSIVSNLAAREIRITVLGDGDTGLIDVVPCSIVKGLEFDHVILVEPADIVEAEDRGLNRLYVCLTRAVADLHILHRRPMPDFE